MNCPKCKNSAIKFGKVQNVQRYRCKICGYQYTKNEPKGKSLSTKFLALYLYLSGVSMRAIGKLIGVSTTAVLYWIREFAQKYQYETPKKTVKAVEIDEMWHFVKKNKISSGHLRLLIEMTENCSPSLVAIETPKPSTNSTKN